MYIFDTEYEENPYKEERKTYLISSLSSRLQYSGKIEGSFSRGLLTGTGSIEGDFKGEDVCKVICYKNNDKKSIFFEPIPLSKEFTDINLIDEGEASVEIITKSYKKINPNLRNPYIYGEEDDKVCDSYVINVPKESVPDYIMLA